MITKSESQKLWNRELVMAQTSGTTLPLESFSSTQGKAIVPRFASSETTHWLLIEQTIQQSSWEYPIARLFESYQTHDHHQQPRAKQATERALARLKLITKKV